MNISTQPPDLRHTLTRHCGDFWKAIKASSQRKLDATLSNACGGGEKLSDMAHIPFHGHRFDGI